MIPPTVDLAGLPHGWEARVPEPADVPAVTALLARYQSRTRGTSGADEESIAAVLVGTGSWTRRQLVLVDGDGGARGWVSVHDRAAGRTMVDLVLDPDLAEADADPVAGSALTWCTQVAGEIAALRELGATQLDATPDAADTRLHRWLTDAGYERVRTWLHMTRPVEPTEELPGPRDGVTVRPVAKHDSGMPVATDIQVVHVMLEESFADHFNSHRESFPEFVQRLREDPGHRWDHWYIAEVAHEDGVRPGGALVSSVMGPDDDGRAGSYVDYIGVHPDARGRGVAKALLHAVINDARAAGRSRVDLEVDAESPTQADQVYAAMGWREKYRTESWHAEAPATDPSGPSSDPADPSAT